MMTTLSRAGVTAVARAATTTTAATTRSITVGTDMMSSVVSLQKSRPWYNSDAEGSNMAADNAVTLKELFSSSKTVAVFGVPAPFTGVCTNAHFPGYRRLADEMRKAGCDEIVCYAVSDPYAMHGWQKSMMNEEESKITMLADPGATFAKAYGVDAVYDDSSLGLRSKRFSMIVCNGIVTNFRIVEDAASDADTLLGELKELQENGGVPPAPEVA